MNETILDEDMILQFKLGCIDYRTKICSICSNKQKKDRDCSLLRGFKNSSCRHMQTAVNNRKEIKAMNKKYVKNMMGDLIYLRDQINQIWVD